MGFRFDIGKSIQVAGHLLKQTPQQEMEYLKFIKLLYILDRESLKEMGYPITGDRAAAMPRGPVLSHILDLIRNRVEGGDNDEWSRHFETNVTTFTIRLVTEPGSDHLSCYEMEKIEEIVALWGDHNRWDLSDLTHEFPEWQRVYPGNSSSRIIPLNEILRAVDKTPEEIAEIEQEAAEERYFDQLFGTS